MQPQRSAKRQSLSLNMAITLLAGATSFACGGVAADELEDADPAVALGATTRPLGLDPTMWRRWPTGVVPYCYQPSAPSSGYPQPGSPAYEESVELTEDAIDKYNALPDSSIDFQGGGLCSNWDTYAVGTDPLTLRIIITDDDAATRTCSQTSIAQGQHIDSICGFNPEAGEEIVIIFGGGFGAPEAAILHELGHALGFRHEYHRRAGTENDCVDDPTLGGGTNGGDAAITEYDVYSVMNATYCHQRAYLSPIDVAGLSYVYPGSTADRLTVVPFSFPFSNGLLTGAASNEPIEFAQRVAGVWAFHYAGATWSRSTSSGWVPVASGSSVTLTTALGSAALEGTIRAQFTDEFDRFRTSPAMTIRRDARLATALLLAAL